MHPLKVLTLCAIAVLLLGLQPYTERAAVPDTSHGGPVRAVSHIGGSAADVVVQDNYAYVGYAGELAVVDISDGASPRRIGYAVLSANDLAMQVPYVYVAGTQGLRIVDVSTPADPHVVGEYATERPAVGIWVSGNTAFMVTNRGGLHIVDVRNPHRPTPVSFLDISGRMPDIAVAVPYAYIVNNDGLHVVNVSNPYQPVPVASLDLPGFAADLTLSGDRLFLTNEFKGLVLVDISDPLHPVELRNVTLNSMVWDVVVAGDVAYVGSTEPGIHVIEGVRGGVPRPISRLPEPSSLWALAMSEGRLFGVNMDGDLHIFTLADAGQPLWVGMYDAPGYSVRVAAEDTRAYVVADVDGSVYELDPLVDPMTATNLHVAPDFTVALAATKEGFIASGKTTALWAGTGQRGSRHSCERIYPAQWALCDVAVSGSCIYGTGKNLGLLWVEEPAVKPLHHGIVPIEDARTIAASGQHVYVGGNNGLYVFRHDPERAPEPVGYVEAPGPVDLVRAQGADGFAIINSQRLCAIDFRNPSRPVFTGCLHLAAPASGAVRYGDHVYVSIGDAGIAIIELTNLTQPAVVGRIDIAGSARHVAAADGFLYIATGAGGLFVLRL